jgi:hypothetical protein
MAAERFFLDDEPYKTPDLRTDEALDATATAYFRASAPAVARARQETAKARLSALAEAGVLPGLMVEHWPDKASVPADGPEPEPVERYDEFVGALGDAGHLDPFFEDRPGVGRSSRVVVLPVVALALRRDGELTGLYPCWIDGHHYSIEQGLAALEKGEHAENLVDPEGVPTHGED